MTAATATESQPAPVCSVAARPPDRDTTAVCSGHHLTDAAGTTEYVQFMQNLTLGSFARSKLIIIENFSLKLSLFLGILQAQSLLSQLPQSQANLLSTQSISLAPQVKTKVSKSAKRAFLASYFGTERPVSFRSRLLRHARQQLHLFRLCPTVRHHPND